jgi:hypothetical protein
MGKGEAALSWEGVSERERTVGVGFQRSAKDQTGAADVRSIKALSYGVASPPGNALLGTAGVSTPLAVRDGAPGRRLSPAAVGGWGL